MRPPPSVATGCNILFAAAAGHPTPLTGRRFSAEGLPMMIRSYFLGACISLGLASAAAGQQQITRAEATRSLAVAIAVNEMCGIRLEDTDVARLMLQYRISFRDLAEFVEVFDLDAAIMGKDAAYHDEVCPNARIMAKNMGVYDK